MLDSVLREKFSNTLMFEREPESSEGGIPVPVSEGSLQAAATRARTEREAREQNWGTVGRPVWLEEGKRGCPEGVEIRKVAEDQIVESLVGRCEGLGFTVGKVGSHWQVWRTMLPVSL